MTPFIADRSCYYRRATDTRQQRQEQSMNRADFLDKVEITHLLSHPRKGDISAGLLSFPSGRMMRC
jgi:hypothetical protein